MKKETLIRLAKNVPISFLAAFAAMAVLGIVLVNSAGEPITSGWNSSGHLGIGTSSPGTALGVRGVGNLEALTVEGVLKASNVVATGTVAALTGDVIVADGTKGVRLKDSDGAGCHRITVNTSGALVTKKVDCSTGAVIATTDNFESYSDLASWNGLSGGAEWTGSWDEFDPEGGSQIVSTPTLQGSRSGRTYGDSGGSFGVRRSFGGKTAGVLTLIARKAATSGPGGYIRLKEGANVRGEIIFDSDGNIKINNNGTLDTVQAYSVDTNYTVDVSFDATTDKYKVRIDGGSYTADKTVVGGAMTQVDTLEFHRPQVAGGHYFWVDDIKID